MNPLFSIARQFKPDATILDVREYGSGNVNDTYLVSLDDAREPNFILQHINTHVFRRPELIMLNMRLFTEHMQNRLAHESLNSHRWEMPSVLRAVDGQTHFIDDEGKFWRAISFIDHSRSFDQVQGTTHAHEVGFALGKFHHLISDLDSAQLHDTLEGFHITPRYLQQYDEALAQYSSTRTALVEYGINFIEHRRAFASVLEDAKARGTLRVRAMHGDPKVNNIMIDESNGQAVSIVDLDTVKPGLVHYDIGDCLRSSCNPLGEETMDFNAVYFDVKLAEAILRGYLPMANGFLSEDDYNFLYDAIRLLPFELGIRFFTDYLRGNVYFKTKHQEHNLHRAVVQFKLTKSIEEQETEIRKIIDELR